MRADILLVTATKVETKAVLEAFGRPQTNAQSINGRVYFDLGTVKGARARMTRCEMGAGGLGAAQQAIHKGIADLSPSAVVMVGIAFGVSEEKQTIGDVLVTEQLRPYELQRVGTQGNERAKITLRDDKPHVSPWLLNLFKSSEITWEGAALRFGTVLTGAKLVDNVDFREQLRAFEPEAIGGEMEGAGLYVACYDQKVDWILVKAICDFADGHKGEDKAQRQELAANNAAAFVHHALQFVRVDWGMRHGIASRMRTSVLQRSRSSKSDGTTLVRQDQSRTRSTDSKRRSTKVSAGESAATRASAVAQATTLVKPSDPLSIATVTTSLNHPATSTDCSVAASAPANWDTLGERAHYVMFIREISPSALDLVLEKEQGYTARLVRSSQHPKADTVSRLSKALGVPVEFLVEGQSNLWLADNLQNVALAARRLRHKVKTPLGDLFVRSLFDFPFLIGSREPAEPQIYELDPVDVFAMGALAMFVGARPPAPEEDYKAIKAAFTITARAIERTGLPHDRVTLELGSAWLDAMLAVGTGASRAVPNITDRSILASAKAHEEATGQAPPLRVFPNWWMAARDAKRRCASVSPEYIDMVGDLRIPLDGGLDEKVVTNLARGLYDAALRGGIADESRAQQAAAPDGAPSLAPLGKAPRG